MIETIDTVDIKHLLGKRIRELRIQRGYTQEYLSEQIGIGQRNLSKIECGNNFITAETLSKILYALKVEPQELFNFDRHKEDNILKSELLKAINNNNIDIKLLYQFYQAIK